ncbi:MAG: hypothetical protein QXG39_03805 [Candidatus Aenigmatarchaeota archaeon]
MERLISPSVVPIIGFITASVAVLFMIARLPRDFKKTFGPAVYLTPIMSGWGIYQFLSWINHYINAAAVFLFLIIIPGCVTAFVMLAAIKYRSRQIQRNIRQIVQMNSIATRRTAQSLQTVFPRYDIYDYYAAPLIQHWDSDGGWKPTSLVPIDKNTPLTKDWVTVDIETPEIVRPGDLVIIRVDLINNHPARVLYDKGVLEIVYPNGIKRGYGPDSIFLESQETLTLYYKWIAPLFQGNFILRYHLFSLQSKTEKVLVVE